MSSAKTSAFILSLQERRSAVRFQREWPRSPIPAKPFEHWLGLADTALYEAKEGGGNRVKSEGLELDPSHEKIIKVAIVDDDPIIRTVMSDIVEKLPQQAGVRYDVNHSITANPSSMMNGMAVNRPSSS